MDKKKKIETLSDKATKILLNTKKKNSKDKKDK